MADDGLSTNDLVENGLDVLEARRMLKVDGLDASDPFSIVEYCILLIVKVARLNESVEHNVAIVVDNAYSG